MKTQRRFLLFNAMLYMVLVLISAIFVHRIIDFHGVFEPGGILIFPVTYFLGDVITEVYGYKISRNILLSSLILQFLFAVLIKLILYTPTAPFFHEQEYYISVLRGLIPYSLWFALGTLVGGMLNIITLTKLKILFKSRFFWLRSLGSTTAGEFFFSIITLVPSLIGFVSFSNALKIALSAYLFKLIYGLLIVAPSSWLVFLLKKFETQDPDTTDQENSAQSNPLAKILKRG